MGASPTISDDLEQGRRACERRDWRAAHERLGRAGARAPLGAADLWLLATAAHLLGRHDEFVDALQRAHRLHREAGECEGAVRCAFWLGLHLAEAGETAQASGWFARAGRMVEGAEGACVERGYLLLADAFRRFGAGDADGAFRCAEGAAELARRFGDADLQTLAVHVQGRALVHGGSVQEGLSLLDEAMVAVLTDHLSPQVTGLVYCSVIGACRSVHDLARAGEWTAALAGWCARQPEMVAYSGECRVYRAELMHFHGAWRDALDEARRARERGAARGAAAALALYQEGEAHRLLGDLAAAEEAYAAAGTAGREPQPGLSLLRLAQGDPRGAAAGIRRALAETADPLQRARLLPAHVEVALAAGEVDEAGRSCEELGEVAARYGSAVLGAAAAHARGAVALAAGRPGTALPHLRRAARGWDEVEAPYDAARSRALLGLACRELGDGDAAALALGAAREAFGRLGAAADAARLDALPGGRTPAHAAGLTERELEVLARVATGATNRAVGRALFISEKTVARHLSNIFRKLGVSSRAAATAYAFRHRLLEPPA